MSKPEMQLYWNSSVLDGGNAAYLEALYEQYLADPRELCVEWRRYFEQLAPNPAAEVSPAMVQQAFILLAKEPAGFLSGRHPQRGVEHSAVHEHQQIRVQQWIQAYRLQGNRLARIDPLQLTPMPEVPELSLAYHGLEALPKSTVFDIGDFVSQQQYMTLEALEEALKQSYCGPIATEFLHIVSKQERDWIQHRIEGSRCQIQSSAEQRERLLGIVTKAEGLEKYIGAKYPGAKRFSLEGGDAFLVLLDTLIQGAGQAGMKEVVIGMAHRGRLNVLVNTLGKIPRDLFAEFEGKHHVLPETFSGDVKYHQGFSSDIQTPGGMVHVSLAFNPSHLEIVTPVIEGSVRARQMRWQDEARARVLPIAVHGDAAFAGQGVVMETLNMSQTRGYGVGGSIHIVINNQVGFTTSCPEDARSTLYCSDVAKIIQAPVFHVNADEPEAVNWVAKLALEYKQTFKKDVVIDLVCYRRHGHNEADEPAATQPLMYQKIRKHATVRQLYGERLVAAGLLTPEQVDALVAQNRTSLDQGDCVAQDVLPPQKSTKTTDWSLYFEEDWRVPVETGLAPEVFRRLNQQLTTIPTDMTLHPRVAKIIEERRAMAAGQIPCDWGFGEVLAYAGLSAEGFDIRLSGQDCGRGTFFHRHAVLHCQKTGSVLVPLATVNPKQNVTLIDSLLSEEAVLAFEYGYASASADTLVIWEAQFGDFANGAQVVIDQFISSGEQKWGRLCGLTLLLPHGYEGQGPEHSSARLERFLQLCAEHNIQVCVPTTPAQVFHMLRRQMIRRMRKPLVVMSPKSLLRHKEAVSSVSEFIEGRFYPVLPDQPLDIGAKQPIVRVVLCSGKVYYDLVSARSAENLGQVAIIRIEQLYPFPKTEIMGLLAQYIQAKQVIWCQEEPQNQGAWYAIQHHLRACLADHQTLAYAGRAASAAPAVGYAQLHQQQQEALVNQALHEKATHHDDY